MRESTFEGVGGLKIFTRSWQPEGKTRDYSFMLILRTVDVDNIDT